MTNTPDPISLSDALTRAEAVFDRWRVQVGPGGFTHGDGLRFLHALREAFQPAPGETAHKATCETNGHLFGHIGTCIMCGAAKPPAPGETPETRKIYRYQLTYEFTHPLTEVEQALMQRMNRWPSRPVAMRLEPEPAPRRARPGGEADHMTRGEMATAIRRALNKFDEWNDVTGLVSQHSGYYYELQGVIEDAVHCGAQAALKLQGEPLPSEGRREELSDE